MKTKAERKVFWDKVSSVLERYTGAYAISTDIDPALRMVTLVKRPQAVGVKPLIVRIKGARLYVEDSFGYTYFSAPLDEGALGRFIEGFWLIKKPGD
jgi:hypothetical protein